MSDAMKLDIGAALEQERQWRDTRSKSKGRRVKIEKVNQAWLVRFLPVALGKSGLFYVRQGQHWLNKSPIHCPRDTSVEFGGNPDADCHVCALSEELNNMPDDKVSKFGFSIRSNVSYITYCLVYEVDYGRGDNEIMSAAEILKPWEFDHYQGSFDELTDYFRRGASDRRPWSVLDLERGNDFWATKTTKGIRLDRQDPGCIIEKDANFDANLDAIFNSIQLPRIKIPTTKELEAFARKSEDAAFGEGGGDDRGGHRGGGGGGGGHRGGGRGVEEQDQQDNVNEDDRPSRRFGRASGGTSGRRMARPTVPEAEAPEAEGAGEDTNSDAPPAEGEDQVPGAEVPARRPAAAPARTAAHPTPSTRPAAAPSKPAAAPASARPAAPAARPAATAARPAAAATAARPATTAARPVATAARPAPAVAPAARRPAAAAPAATPVSARRAAPTPAEGSVNEDEDPGIAEEANDQAPPAEEPPEEGEALEGQEAPPEGEEAPPEGGDQEEAPPNPAPAKGNLRNRLMTKLQNR